MSKHDYTKLDAAILARITAAKCIFYWQLDSGHVKAESQLIADAVNLGRRAWRAMPSHRVLDRRLQALRKAGLIRYSRKPEGWTLAAPEASQG